MTMAQIQVQDGGFPSLTPQQLPTGGMLSVSSAREIQEVQGAIISAKHFPRDQSLAYKRIVQACTRQKLAEEAMYAYPKGSQIVSGPSIRLAEVLAQNWGNLHYGIRALSHDENGTNMEAFCWDIETNVRQNRIFYVAHERHSKKGVTKLTDPRDIYEIGANLGSRRLRACILGIIPGDIVQAAQEQCEKTLQGGGGLSREDRIRKMLVAFDEFGVSKAMIEERLGHNIDATIDAELVQLTKIYKSLKDGMAKREDFFSFKTDEATTPKEVNEKASAEIKQKHESKLLDAIDNRIGALTEQGVTEEEIFGFLKVKSFDDMKEWPPAKLQTALEILNQYKRADELKKNK